MIDLKINKSTENLVKEKNNVIESYAKENGLKADKIKQAIDGYKKLTVAKPYIKMPPRLELNHDLEIEQISYRSKGKTPKPLKASAIDLLKRPSPIGNPRREAKFNKVIDKVSNT
jgi:hypothetical protein